jgi:hypothetical protein
MSIKIYKRYSSMSFMGTIGGAYSEIKFYMQKYPWIYYYGILSAVLSFIFGVYNDSITSANPIDPIMILIKFLISGFFFIFAILIFTLIVKHVLDNYFKAGEKGYVYYPFWLFFAGILLSAYSIYLFFNSASATMFINIKNVHYSNMIKSVILLLVNTMFFFIYRKKN